MLESQNSDPISSFLCLNLSPTVFAAYNKQTSFSYHTIQLVRASSSGGILEGNMQADLSLQNQRELSLQLSLYPIHLQLQKTEVLDLHLLEENT